MELKTERLTLRPVTRNEIRDIFDNFTDEVTTYMYPDPASDIGETRDFVEKSIEKFTAGTDVVFIGRLSASDEFIGCFGLHHIDRKTPELGVWIKKSAHGNGYGLEGVRAVIEHAKTNYLFDYLLYPVDKRNTASRRIPERSGAYIHRTYQENTPGGKTLDLIEYRIPCARSPQ